jgi:hypothetical protein
MEMTRFFRHLGMSAPDWVIFWHGISEHFIRHTIAKPDLNHPDPIDSRRLLTFVTVAETETLTEAASRLCLTRSAVSHALKSLELDIGCSLFDRKNKSLSLTSQGRQLLPYARSILDTMHDARKELMASL